MSLKPLVWIRQHFAPFSSNMVFVGRVVPIDTVVVFPSKSRSVRSRCSARRAMHLIMLFTRSVGSVSNLATPILCSSSINTPSVKVPPVSIIISNNLSSFALT